MKLSVRVEVELDPDDFPMMTHAELADSLAQAAAEALRHHGVVILHRASVTRRNTP